MITIHRLDNPAPGQPATCECGWRTESISLPLWKLHIEVATAGQQRQVIHGTAK